MFGSDRVAAVPNMDPDGSNWAVLFGAFDPEEEAESDTGDGEEHVGIVCLTEDSDLPGVTEVEHRFSLWEDSAENPHAVYYGVALHRHSDEVEEGCETFRAADGRADLDDIPDDLRGAVEDLMEMEIHAPGDEPVDAEPILPDDLMDDDPNPRGFQ